jgi:dienelactone hydrolase
LIPLLVATELQTTLNEAGIPNSLNIYPGARHGLVVSDNAAQTQANQQDAFNRSMTFFDQHLK